MGHHRTARVDCVERRRECNVSEGGVHPDERLRLSAPARQRRRDAYLECRRHGERRAQRAYRRRRRQVLFEHPRALRDVHATILGHKRHPMGLFERPRVGIYCREPAGYGAADRSSRGSHDVAHVEDERGLFDAPVRQR